MFPVPQGNQSRGSGERCGERQTQPASTLQIEAADWSGIDTGNVIFERRGAVPVGREEEEEEERVFDEQVQAECRRRQPAEGGGGGGGK